MQESPLHVVMAPRASRFLWFTTTGQSNFIHIPQRHICRMHPSHCPAMMSQITFSLVETSSALTAAHRGFAPPSNNKHALRHLATFRLANHTFRTPTRARNSGPKARSARTRPSRTARTRRAGLDGNHPLSGDSPGLTQQTRQSRRCS